MEVFKDSDIFWRVMAGIVIVRWCLEGVISAWRKR